jgi:kinetochore protein Spc25
MSSAFEPSLSTSQHRQSMAPVGPSAADTLPSIDFGFDDLRDRMAKFTARFDAFIEQGKKRVYEERNQFRMNMAELQGTPAWTELVVSELKELTKYPFWQRTSA